MIRKFQLYNRLREEPADPLAHELEQDGHTFRRQAFSAEITDALRDDVVGVFERFPPDKRKNCLDLERGRMFRYEMFNRSARCQEVLARRELLDVVEPVLGDDCHVVACTAWRNPPGNAYAPYGQEWHVDGGPHVIRPAGVPWPDAIPYPIFVVTAHVYLEPVRFEDGPTAILPGSHRSGGLPPHDRRLDLDLTYDGRPGLAHIAEPGDVGFFASDSWHRRLPPQVDSRGRFFLQVIYGRREIAQRVLPCDEHNPASAEARSRATTTRERELLGIHDQGFYDA